MSQNILEIPRNYSDGNDLTAAILDEILDPIETYADINNQNLKQIILDMFGPAYALDNDGAANYSQPIQESIQFPEYLIWHEDFLESAGSLTASVNAGLYLGNTLVGSGTAAIIADAVNGILRLATGTTINSSVTVSTLNKFLDTNNEFEIEMRFKLSALTSNKFEIGIAIDTNDYFILRYDSSTGIANFVIASRASAGVEATTVTSIPVAAETYYVVKLSISASGSVTMYLDGSSIAANHSGGIISSANFRPFVYVQNLSADNKNVDLDYVRVVQSRNE